MSIGSFWPRLSKGFRMEVSTDARMFFCLDCGGELTGERTGLDSVGDCLIQCLNHQCGKLQLFFGCYGGIGSDGMTYNFRL